jgi:hypothetical protein
MIPDPSFSAFRQAYRDAAYGSGPLAIQPRVVSLNVSSRHGSLRMLNGCSDFRHHYRHYQCGGRK